MARRSKEAKERKERKSGKSSVGVRENSHNPLLSANLFFSLLPLLIS